MNTVRMLGKTGLRPYVYGRGTGRMKKCLGCPAEDCGYHPDKRTMRQREKRNWKRDVRLITYINQERLTLEY